MNQKKSPQSFYFYIGKSLCHFYLKEVVRNLELTKDEATQEKENQISGLLEQLKQTQELHNEYVKDKDNEISNMKDEFQLELDGNNEFVLNQINVLRQELTESRFVYLM